MAENEMLPNLEVACGTFTLTKGQQAAILESVALAKKERETRMPDEQSAIRALFDAYIRLKDFAWHDATYAPIGEPLEVIEVGSTGIHKATRDDERRFWIHADNDSWPSRPVLFRKDIPRESSR